MSAIANIVINDGQATPVAHTFAPARTSTDKSFWEDRAAGIYVGYNKLTMTLTRPTGQANGSRNLKLSILVETPKLETVSNNTVTGIAPAPTVSYRPQAELVVTFPERCSLQDRKDLRAYMQNLLANAFVQDAFEKFELGY